MNISWLVEQLKRPNLPFWKLDCVLYNFKTFMSDLGNENENGNIMMIRKTNISRLVDQLEKPNLPFWKLDCVLYNF